MSDLDKKYIPTKSSRTNYSSGIRGRPQTQRGWVRASSKEDVRDEAARLWMGYLVEALGIDPYSAEYNKISDLARQDLVARKILKDELAEMIEERQKTHPFSQAVQYNKRLQSASVLLGALYSYTKSRFRSDLDDGITIDNPVFMITGRDGWGDEMARKGEYRKHVNLIVDNSGSTRTAEMGYCYQAMNNVADSILDILAIAAAQYGGISWGAFTFNRVAFLKGYFGKELNPQKYSTRSSYFWGPFSSYAEPEKNDTQETNLAPLLQIILDNEQKWGLFNQPRLDIILTDGEFENQGDADGAAQFQHRRGLAVTTYVINLGPKQTNIKLPPTFREIPLEIIKDGGRIGSDVREDGLRNTLNQIVVNEMVRE